MKYIIPILITFLGIGSLTARNTPESEEGKTERRVSFRNDCAIPSSDRQVDLAINNVRARLLTGGDIWWDLDNGRYIVPAVEPGSGQREVSSLFAGSVWVGGLQGDNLKMAANTYRSDNGGNDWFPGPLTVEGETEAETCLQWDRHFRVRGSEIDDQQRLLLTGELTEENIPDGVKYWPAKGNPYFESRFGFELPFNDQGLGSFNDVDGDGNYNPFVGDFPVIDIRGCALDQYPDEMYFWIYNDAGGDHTSAVTDQDGNDGKLRMEVQVQAFAYATNDEINNMTFYRYKLINRGQLPLDSTFFAMWVDPDLGCSGDDFIGCDTTESLMYLYNEDAIDGDVGAGGTGCQTGENTYGTEVPMLGVDYFRGPLGPKVLVIDTFISEGQETYDTTLRNPTRFEDLNRIDAEGRLRIVELGMNSFTYHVRGDLAPQPGMEDPDNAAQYYNLITGSWRDGTPYTFGGTGYQDGETPVRYAFPSPPDDPNGWSMCTADIGRLDPRTIQASGPFRLVPGAVNELIIGVVWTPDIQTYPCPDITPLLTADVKAQNLFNACFDIQDGPDAPDLNFVELDQQVIATLSNDTVRSNNSKLSYREIGFTIPPNASDRNYVFEGYQVYQLAGPTVDPAADGVLEDITQARLVYQADIVNDVSKIYNWTGTLNPIDPQGGLVYSATEEVNGRNDGIENSFIIRDDAFNSGTGLINYQTYYYYAIAYAYNNYDTFNTQTGLGQQTPYIVGRRNTRVYEVVPRPTAYINLKAEYGEEPVVTRISGQGSAGEFLSFSKEQREAMLNEDYNGEITYDRGLAPIEVKVFNPLEVKNGTYIVEFFNEGIDGQYRPEDTKFRVTREEDGQTFSSSEVTIDVGYEQLLPDWGISVQPKDVIAPGDFNLPNNGAVGSSLDYEDDSLDFLEFWQEDAIFNYMKTGNVAEDDNDLDPQQGFTQTIDGPFYPFMLLDFNNQSGANDPFVSPTWMDPDMSNVREANPLSSLNNVDIVLTPDRSKWSKCIVVETYNGQWSLSGLEAYNTAEFGHSSNEVNMDVIRKTSKGLDESGNLVDLPDEREGFSYFPGYAVDAETGERLNIFFGENTAYSALNAEEIGILDGVMTADSILLDSSYLVGGDMIFNPRSEVILDNPRLNELGDMYLGGHHMIFVTDLPYDGCESIYEGLLRTEPSRFQHYRNKIRTLESIKWSNLMLRDMDFDYTDAAQNGDMETEVVARLRVNSPYQPDEVDGELVYNKYRFTIEGSEPEFLENISENRIDSALDLINVVPNPYYAFSEYETGSFSNVVKITNLPPRCEVTIYSLDGKFIRQFERNELPINNLGRYDFNDFYTGVLQENFVPDIEWDLNNARGIPVSSGVYFIHVNAFDLGERVIKWTGVNREFDPSGL